MRSGTKTALLGIFIIVIGFLTGWQLGNHLHSPVVAFLVSFPAGIVGGALITTGIMWNRL